MRLLKGRGPVAFATFNDDFTVRALTYLDVAEWSVRTTIADHDLTTAGVQGSRGGVLGSVTDWVVSLPPDADNLPESSGIASGRAARVWFGIDDLADTWHRLDNSLITFATVTASSMGDLYRQVIQGRHGTLNEYVAEPPTWPSSSAPAAPPPATGGVNQLGGSYPPTIGGL